MFGPHGLFNKMIEDHLLSWFFFFLLFLDVHFGLSPVLLVLLLLLFDLLFLGLSPEFFFCDWLDIAGGPELDIGLVLHGFLDDASN